MEPSESSGLSSYYHHQTVHPSSATPTATASVTGVATNGITPSFGNNSPAAGGSGSLMVYPGSIPSAVSPPAEAVKKKRGRPRKYETPEQAAAAKKISSAASASNSVPKKRDQVPLGGAGGQGGGIGGSIGQGSVAAGQGSGVSLHTLKTSKFAAVGDAGQGFTPHIINLVAGEDVSNKIMTFMQQSKRELCILSASGAVSSASLLQPSISGGNITYEGRFDILSLSGSYVRNGRGGKTGGLSVCLGSSDGQIIGGGVGGPLTAAGQIQVIVGTFVVDTKDTITGEDQHDMPAHVGVSTLPPPPGMGFPSAVNPSPPLHHHHQYMQQQQQRGTQPTPLQSIHWRGDTGHPTMHHSPENGDYEYKYNHGE
ncbi:unnamed protein product [Cuscuta epithymum]|uniref:AT-hook motif nuclear-localized protein n=1 Tax=Cuscuta epithymum TaxID=186058 RepID=A0AAV0E4N4_9ASTE|nr:unnamed protein product [Cuscuta epithymum]